MEPALELSRGQKQVYHGSKGKEYYSKLFWRFILLILLCSVVPLLLVGWGIYVYYSKFYSLRVTETLQSQVEYHRKIIELFLRERNSDLQLIALTQPLDYLKDPNHLQKAFHAMNQKGQYFTDLGVISDQGRHLAYSGPFDLMDKDYSQTFWFKEVMQKGSYISDMFMGYRHVPHFIIAFLRTDGSQRWILRASIETAYFRSLVEDVKIGRTGEVFLANNEGTFQTSPRFGGKIMDKSPLPLQSLQKESGVFFLEPGKGAEHQQVDSRQILAYSWLEDPRWILVVKQNYDEAFRQVNHANLSALILLHLSVLAILTISIFITRYMIKVIQRRDAEADQLNRQLIQTGKLASLGELSAGVAHEINNPLAIILTENQVVRDSLDETPDLNKDFKKDLLDSLGQIDTQVQRCSLITQNLLRFSRRTKSTMEKLDLNAFLKEVVQLMEGQGKGVGVHFTVDLDPELSPILSDPSQLQQVFLNLINNAIDAHKGKAYGAITISNKSDPVRQGVEIVVADTGSGISPENIEKIFDPFFTTKPVGKGTGLGLSIVFSTVKQLGGEISVQSEEGKGTTFIIFLPFKAT